MLSTFPCIFPLILIIELTLGEKTITAVLLMWKLKNKEVKCAPDGIQLIKIGVRTLTSVV